MISAGQGLDAFAEAIAVEIRRRKARPFAAFRGDYRKPVRFRAEPGQAGGRRLHAMQIVSDRAANIAKLQRGLRIIKRASAS